MRHLVFDQSRTTFPVALLVPVIRKDEIVKTYFDPFPLDAADVLVLDLHKEGKKTPVKVMQGYVKTELVPALQQVQVQYVLCADADYFKVLTKVAKTEAHLGYVMDTEHGFKVIYVPNYAAVFYDPDKTRAKIAQGMQALVDHVQGGYVAPGQGIIQFADYPRTTEEIAAWLEKLLAMDCPLAIDIEAFDLKHHRSGIGTISFAWNQGEGIAFAVDYVPTVDQGSLEAGTTDEDGFYGRQIRNEPVRALLKSFFIRYLNKALYHNISFDVYILIAQLFMAHQIDTEGLLHGLQVMLRNWDDTQILTYLATNSCAGNKLGLKDQAQEYAGNYAVEEIEDIRKIPLPKLLQYNLVDSLSTWFVYNKHRQTVVLDQQEEIYQGLFKDAIVDIIQMQLTGLPLNMERTKEVALVLKTIEIEAEKAIRATKVIQSYNYRLAEKYIEKKHAEWKVKRITLAEVPDDVVFNPNSPMQLQDLLFGVLGLPVLGYTASKQPETGGDTIETLRSHTSDPDVLAFLNALLDYKAVNKINTAFIPAMLDAVPGPDGWHYLCGNFRLGGTLSGRLSSNNPNLQNLPANVEMALSAALLARFAHLLDGMVKKGKLHLGKLIKSCIQAPPGWIFAGLDFASLEDRISALTTKDPEKLKVYTDGYDGHCLRAFAYFGEEMPDIDPTSVASINSIEVKYKPLRQDSKAPTFALTYQGTWSTLVKNCGFPVDKAKQIEARYQALYQVSIAWVQSKLDEAAKTGYITAAFGLRVRTPLLKQVIRGTSKTPKEAEAEGRSAGNALGQSWCLLNSRAWSQFMKQVRNSPYRIDIRLCAQIHDAGYILVRDNVDVLMYTNQHLVEAVEWQDHPDITHPDVKLGGELSIFWPSWAQEVSIPNRVSEAELLSAFHAHALQYQP